MSEQITLAEALKLVEFRHVDGEWGVQNVKGYVRGDVKGSVCGDVKGDVCGDVCGGVDGDVEGSVGGTVDGDVACNVNGTVWGNVKGDVRGDVEGDVRGNVFGSTNGSAHIKAAPELLAALKRLLQCYEEYPSGQYHGNEVIADCKLAIAKAEGRSE